MKLRAHLQHGRLKCSECDFTTNFSAQLIQHKEAVHLNLKRFYCKICKFETYHKHNIRTHMKINHKESLQFGSIDCGGCENVSEYSDCIKCDAKPEKKQSQVETRNHLRKLKTEGAFKCTEYNCIFSTNHKQSLKNHIECEHKGILKFKCNICEYRSYYKNQVKIHQKSISHLEKKVKILRIDCTFCEEDTPHKEHSNDVRSVRAIPIIKKEKTQNEEQGCYKCLEPECDRVTYFKSELEEHFQSEHATHHRYKCNLCDYKAFNTTYVKSHQSTKHFGEEAKVIGIGCTPCEENIEHKKHQNLTKQPKFGQCLLCKNGIDHSEHSFTPIRNPPNPDGRKGNDCNKYECSVCGKELATSKARQKHFVTEHPNTTIFNCQDCKYGTNYLPNLNTHTNSKHKKKVRQCPHCSYNSTWNTAFLKHMRSAHGLFQKKSKHSVFSEGNPILCDDCGFSTFNQKQFTSHKQAACQATTVMRGGNRFLRYTPAHRNRAKTIGLELGNFKCNKCPFTSDLPIDIRDHVQKVHHGDLPATKQPTSVRNLVSNQDIKFKCNKCTFQTLEPSELRDHMSYHV